MRSSLVMVAVAALAGSARADPPHTIELFDVAGLIGGGTDGFVLGVRPELVVARVVEPGGWAQNSGFGIGVAGELDRIGGYGLVGGSIGLVRLHEYRWLEPALGLYDRLATNTPGASASMYVGARTAAGPKIGLRLTGRVERDQQSIELAAQIDPLFLARVGDGFVRAFTIHN
jgi:hypothetical protein